MVDCTGLENRRTERYRGFESLSLRKKSGTTKVAPDFRFIAAGSSLTGSPAKVGGAMQKV